MNMFTKRIGRFPLGVWIALIVLLLLLIVAWAGQAYSLFNWDGAVDLGLQNERFTGDDVERTWAHESWGVAVADMLWPVPICIVALFGRRGFCHRGCWINPIIAAGTKIGRVLHTPSLHVRIKNAEQCTNCKLCTKVCPMSIDVYECVRDNEPLPSQCVQCGWCNDKCPKDVLSFSFGRE